MRKCSEEETACAKALRMGAWPTEGTATSSVSRRRVGERRGGGFYH